MAETRRVRVAVGASELAWMQMRARAEKTSVSAIATDALRQAMRAQQTENRRRDQRRKAWDECVRWATDGAGLTSEELDAAQRELDGAATR